jgi:nitrate/nitrite-specific signal transduction histidine kinase
MKTSEIRPFVEKAASDTREVMQSMFEDNQRLSRRVAELEVVLAQRESLESMLKQRVAAIEEESQRFSERYVEVEEQNTKLANLYVASYQLNGTRDRARALAAIQEIIINLIGSEELAIWELDDELGALTLAGSFGIDVGQWACVPLQAGLIGSVAASGSTFIAGRDGEQPALDAGLTACIPLKLDEQIVGAIAIFRLLAQKASLEPLDYELFDLLASHAASALYCTRETKGNVQ